MPAPRRPSFRLPQHWPAPADPERAQLLAARLIDSRADSRPNSRAAALIAALGGNSPYLSDLAVRERPCFDLLLRRGPDHVVEIAMARLDALDTTQPAPSIAAALRQAKRQVALAAGIADIGGIWDLEHVTAALTRLAEATLGAAIRHLLQVAAKRGELALADARHPEARCGFVALGMGKLGGRELNYSSDIDLILLYDPSRHTGRQEGDIDLRRIFTRMAADLVTLMQARDADGYVFRTDLRLRPNPSASPLAISLPSAITYYESLGQTWERAALSKARPVAGDLACGAAFLETIRPFIWRRHLDFEVISDLRAMKRRIDRQQRSAPAAPEASDGDPVSPLLGRNLKLGHGGIREIEFLVQAMQLIWGGRAPELRDASTLGALSRLAGGQYMPAGLAEELAQTYRLLRRTEHRLQMQDDRQTHSLPDARAAFEAFACFMGEPGAVALARMLLGRMHRTHAAFLEMFAEPAAAAIAAAVPDRIRNFDLDSDDLAAPLAAMGFSQPGRAAAILTAWRERLPRSLRSERAQALLRDILPALLDALSRQRDPLLALTRFDGMLVRQSAGVQLLSLLAHNPALLHRIAATFGAAPWLADHLAAVPAALEGLLLPEDESDAEKLLRRLVDRQLRSAGSLEEAVGRAGPLVRGEEFRLALAQMEGRIDVDRAGAARTALADAVIRRLHAQLTREHVARHGVVPHGGLVVVALGKAGSREMMVGSDLDLMLVYDHPDDVTESHAAASGRARSLPVSQYYIRFAHALIAALSAPGAEGPLYALDMRLRPSGNKGPVAVSLASFRRYHAERSWTWERMALSRARVVAGPRSLAGRVTTAIRTAIERPDIARERLMEDACAMRARVAHDLPPRGPWDVKLLRGGLLEVEFIAQILQIAVLQRMEGGARLLHPVTRIALARLAASGQLARPDARRLIAADRFWRALQSMLRILFGTELPKELAKAGPTTLDALLHGVAASASLAGMPIRDLADLADRMRQTSQDVRAIFVRLIGEPNTPPK